MPPRKAASVSSPIPSANTATQAATPQATVTKQKAKGLVEIPDFSSRHQWVFELMGKKPAILKISNDDLRAYHEEEKRYKAIRFCENEDSIWVEEQSEQVKKGFIIFNDGTLEVSPTESTKLEFLFRHPEFNKSFRLLDRERDAVSKLKDQELLMQAMNKAYKAPFSEIKMVAMAKGLEASSESVCRIAMMDYARTNPEAFLDAFDNDLIRISALVREAINLGVISNDGKHLRWQDSQNRIMTLAQGVDPIDYAATRLIDPTEENIALVKEIERKVG